jgi:Zn-dependent M28 family amino/carboxypeptidase
MGTTLLAIAGAVALCGSLLFNLVAGATLGPAWLPVALAGAALSALLVLSTLRSGNVSPGGVDNAGSVAILVELARRLAATVGDEIELIFLSPGAEEDHMVGAMRWLDAHGAELQGRPVWALNFDGAGSPGRLVVLASYGPWRRFAPALCECADRAARRLGFPLRHVWLPPAVGIDAIPFHHRGIPCLTFSSGSLGRATFAVHSERDVADHLDAPTLARVAELAEAVVAELERASAA